MSETHVECYAGHRGEETPRCSHLEVRTIEIVEILARWTEPEARLFRLRGDDGRVYVLRLNEKAGDNISPEQPSRVSTRSREVHVTV